MYCDYRLVYLLLLLSHYLIAAFGLLPIVLVPGDGGSQVEARLDGKTYVPHYYCSKKTADYFPIWLNLELVAPYVMDCFVDNFRLVFDPATNTSSNAPQVSIRIPAFGDTASVEFFDVSRISYSAYFNSLVTALLGVGYERNVTVRGAPYDFRRAINDNPEFFVQLKNLIEETYEKNKQTKVVLLAHSMGNPLTVNFLQKSAQAWKDKYIRAFFAVSSPMVGAVKPLKLQASGDNLNIPFKYPLTVRSLQRSLTSTAFLMPLAPFWNSSEILASRPGRNYTVNDYKAFFEDLDFSIGYQMRESSIKGYNPVTPPGVEVHCIYGVGLPTPAKFSWTESGWPDSQPQVEYGDGDGTVNYRSSSSCYDLWHGKQKFPVYKLEVQKAEHLDILHREEFLNYTMRFLADKGKIKLDSTLYYRHV